jgi:hypothetical protein
VKSRACAQVAAKRQADTSWQQVAAFPSYGAASIKKACVYNGFDVELIGEHMNLPSISCL